MSPRDPLLIMTFVLLNIDVAFILNKSLVVLFIFIRFPNMRSKFVMSTPCAPIVRLYDVSPSSPRLDGVPLLAGQWSLSSDGPVDRILLCLNKNPLYVHQSQ